MNDFEISQLAQAWVQYWHSRERDKGTEPRGGYSEQSRQLWGAGEKLSDIQEENPEELWKLILAIQSFDHSTKIQEVLSAGPIEDLLAEHGALFISRVEDEAKRDPSFASTLGGVWKSTMTDEVWERLQKVWDRRGWNGNPS